MPAITNDQRFTPEDIAKAFGESLQPWQMDALLRVLNSALDGRQGFGLPTAAEKPALLSALRGTQPAVVIVDELPQPVTSVIDAIPRMEEPMPARKGYDWREAQHNRHRRGRNRVR